MEILYVPAYFDAESAQTHALLSAQVKKIFNAEVWRGGELFGFICDGTFRFA